MAVLLEYKCLSCGGALQFDSGTQKLKCPYCNTVQTVEALEAYETSVKEEVAEDTVWSREPAAQLSQEEADALQTFVCQSCGGEITTEATTAATHCPYCGNPVVLQDRVAGQLRPDLVLPFQLDRNAAVAALSAHLQKKPLLPKDFKTANHLQKIQGIYVPFWLFDTGVDADVRYRATRVRHWSDSRYNYTRTSFYSLLRSGSMGYTNVPVDGSAKMDDKLMESIEPYDMTKAVDFETAYLAGYLADKFDVSSDACKQRANDRIRASTESYFASTTAGYLSVIPERSNIRYRNSHVRYALLPVWLLTSRYGDKTYTFAMNGQTGKMVGNLPISWRNFFIYLLSIGIGSGLLISLFAYIDMLI